MGHGTTRPVKRGQPREGRSGTITSMDSMTQDAAGVRTFLRREESYAVHAIAYVAENPGSSSAKIAKDLRLPPAFLAKVLRRLAVAGYVENRQGRSGGVTLIVDPGEITLLDVVQTVSGPLLMDTCQTHQQCATQLRKGYCNVNAMWVRTTLLVHDAFESVKMADLIDRNALERLRKERVAAPSQEPAA